MNRQENLNWIDAHPEDWDVIIIGGGATGLGTAVDAAARGYKTVLFEQADFAKGTSSRSTKLIHGGVRYLKQGNIALVVEALHERGTLIRNAPHLVHHLAFVVPNYSWWEGPFYGIGLKLYDMLAGELGLGPSHILSREETLQRIPTVEKKGLQRGVIYFDGQFDDARLAICLAHTATDLGARLVNYCRVVGLVKQDGMVRGVRVKDEMEGRLFQVEGKVVINATGAFSDQVRQMDEPTAQPVIRPSQGIHLVLDRRFLPGDSAIMVPHTDDGRVLFAVPWHNRVLVGTTDTPMDRTPLEPCPLAEEIDFLLEHAARYLAIDPRPEDVLSCFAGLRPLVGTGDAQDTASLSRDHTILVSTAGLVTIAGGKWTTYRKMAQDVVDQAALVGCLQSAPSRTRHLPLHGYLKDVDPESPRSVYGSDWGKIEALMKEDASLAEPLHPRLPYLKAEVVWAVREEMACTVEDVLARRTRALLLDARAALDAAPMVADLMARELGQDEQWRACQLKAMDALVSRYLIDQSC
ncbi:MAG: glycerol-3-phosphate dehydrogenase/oxidase [Calditrichaeota bacterium]|nr:MAG: glycerol-3-phosphate dehydrogenase/oxidase [Calditrichota bacterium]